MSKSSKKPKFFRDGYTDICGKFEYAQTSGDKLRDVENFAILVYSPDYGSKIITTPPPKVEVEEKENDAAPVGFSNMQANRMERLQKRQIVSKNRKRM